MEYLSKRKSTFFRDTFFNLNCFLAFSEFFSIFDKETFLILLTYFIELIGLIKHKLQLNSSIFKSNDFSDKALEYSFLLGNEKNPFLNADLMSKRVIAHALTEVDILQINIE